MDLREKTIERLKDEDNFDMFYWAPEEYCTGSSLVDRLDKNVCKTACCLAGNIVLAAKDLGLVKELPQTHMGWEDLAREIWATTYGAREAYYLDFFDAGTDKVMEQVTADDDIAHLKNV